MKPVKKFFSNGKLLITGEYLVMEGAKALALPLKIGQSLEVSVEDNPNERRLWWRAEKLSGLWFEAVFELPSLRLLSGNNKNLSANLHDILQAVKKLNAGFFDKTQSSYVKTRLDFPPEYGFGSSSTLVYNLAQWTGVDAFKLQLETFGGSAYDVACAATKKPLFYRLVNGKQKIETVEFYPSFASQLYFVYLGKKQNSAISINRFRKKANYGSMEILRITEITNEILQTKDFDRFTKLLEEHERIMSRILGLPTVKELYFKNCQGTAKSLGAWGGDFVLFATRFTEKEFKIKLQKLGFDTVFCWNELIYKK